VNTRLKTMLLELEHLLLNMPPEDFTNYATSSTSLKAIIADFPISYATPGDETADERRSGVGRFSSTSALSNSSAEASNRLLRVKIARRPACRKKLVFPHLGRFTTQQSNLADG
jgi:hypothetical protein